MSELSVEPVESVDDADVPAGIDAPEYVLYGGKGGVGKTTCAAATGLASARDGTATLVVSTDPAHSLSDTLDADIPAEPAKIKEEIPLFAVEIDPEAAPEGPFTAGAEAGAGAADGPQAGSANDPGADAGGFGPMGGDDGMGGMGGMAEMLGGGHPLAGGAMPGADEAAAMQLLLEYLDDPRFDRVVVDTAPTGHTLRLLELPDVMDSMVGRLLSFREKLSGMAGSLGNLGGLFGGDDADEEMEQGMDDLKELSAKIERLRAALRDPSRTDFRVVMVPEEMSVVESERLVDRLEGFGIPVNTVVVNRVSEDLADVAGFDEEWFVAPDTEHCEFCRRRWEVQRNALQRAQELFRGRTVKRVPLFAEPVHGEAMLGVVAACLE
jgi:arsenite-transporting ATPase